MAASICVWCYVLIWSLHVSPVVMMATDTGWCSSLCTCYNNYSTVDCARRVLTVIPPVSNLTVNLYLDHNKLQQITKHSFDTLHNIKILNLDDNLLESVSAEDFCDLRNLQRLNLNHNMLKTFTILQNSTAGCKLTEMKILTLSYNKLEELPNNLADLTPSLSTLNLSFNYLNRVSFDKNFTPLQSLRVLDLRGNPIHHVSADDFSGLKDTPLVTLSLSECGLTHIDPEALTHMTELASLSLSRNLISSSNLEAIFKAMHRNNTRLIQVDLSEMFLSNLTKDLLGSVQHVTVLDVYDSAVKFIEPSLFDHWPELETLNIGQNELYDLPNVGSLKKLKLLYAGWNKLNDIDLTGLGKLQVIDLSGNNMGTLSEEWLGAKTNLQHLNISHNRITYIHQQAFEGLSLEVLDLSHNQLTSVNGTGVKRLNLLDISYNMLSVIGPGLFADIADSLKVIDLSHNNISYIQNKMFQDFISLQELNLSYNRLGTALAEGSLTGLFSSMSHLQHLDLSGNDLITVEPGQWRYLHHVNTLSLSYNHIRSLSDVSLDELTTVARLVIDYNELSVIDTQTLDKLDYLEEVDFNMNLFLCTDCAVNPLRQWVNYTSVKLLGADRYQCVNPIELSGQLVLDYRPSLLDTDCESDSQTGESGIDWKIIVIILISVIIFILLGVLVFFHSKLCHKIKDFHYQWQIRYREVSGVEFNSNPKV